MTKSYKTLNKGEITKLKKLRNTSYAYTGLGIIISLSLAYLSYLFIKIIFDEFRRSPYDHRHAEYVDLIFTTIIFGFLVLFSLWISYFAFRWMFLNYSRKLRAIKIDLHHKKKEIIKGFLIGVDNRRHGFLLKLDTGDEVEVDFWYLITSGYKIVESSIQVQSRIEISRLPKSFLCYAINYPDYPEYKDEVILGGERLNRVSGIITFAFIFNVGTHAKYKGIKLDRKKLILQIGNYPLQIESTKLPEAASYKQQVIREYMEVKL